MDVVSSIAAHRARSTGAVEAAINPECFGVEDPVAAMDAHTRGLLARRGAERRSWLLPRSLMVADLLALSLAYLLVTLLWGGKGAFGSWRELLVFAVTLPCWIFVAKLHGLYRRDYERAAHSSTDDVAGVFSLVAIGLWLLLVASQLTGRSGPAINALIAFWVLAVCTVPVARRITREACKQTMPTSRTR